MAAEFQVCDVFLSYAQAGDRERAKEIAARLTELGWNVFWDRDIVGGQRWREVLAKQLHAARCIVVLWSTSSVRSRWVQAEAQVGFDRDVLIPTVLESGVKIPFPFGDHQAPSLVDWRRSADRHEGFDSLVRGIEGLAGKPSATVGAKMSWAMKPATTIAAPAASGPTLPKSPTTLPTEPEAEASVAPSAGRTPPPDGVPVNSDPAQPTHPPAAAPDSASPSRGRPTQGLEVASKMPAASTTSTEAMMAKWRYRMSGDHYVVLGLSPDADLGEIRSKASEALIELKHHRDRSTDPVQRAQLETVMARVQTASDVLGVPGPRARFDGNRGNFRGISRCIMGGLGPLDLERLRQEHLTQHPTAAWAAHVKFLASKGYESNGQLKEALDASEAALQLDPLNFELHRRYATLAKRLHDSTRP